MKEAIQEVYELLQARVIHPSGEFKNGNKFYLDNSELVNVRAPSWRYPYSQMVAGRTKKYVKAFCEKYKCKNKQELIDRV